jgi:hypothetical protein
MTLELQFKIKNNSNYLKYLRENSYWYKILNRNPYLFKQFEDEVKKAYQLRTSDKINKTLQMIELLQNVVSNIK